MDGFLLPQYVRVACGTYLYLFAKYSTGRLNMALELAKHNPVYEDIASKFFEVGTITLQFYG